VVRGTRRAGEKPCGRGTGHSCGSGSLEQRGGIASEMRPREKGLRLTELLRRSEEGGDGKGPRISYKRSQGEQNASYATEKAQKLLRPGTGREGRRGGHTSSYSMKLFRLKKTSSRQLGQSKDERSVLKRRESVGMEKVGASSWVETQVWKVMRGGGKSNPRDTTTKPPTYTGVRDHD